jgi:aldehyde dehydrogenase
MDDKRIRTLTRDVARALGEPESTPVAYAGWKRFDDGPATPASAPAPSVVRPEGRGAGVFATVEQAYAAAAEAFQAYQEVSLEQRYAIVDAVRRTLRAHCDEISKLGAEETGLGRAADKVRKNRLVIDKTPGPEALRPEAWSGDHGLTIMEPAPYGVIGSITPSTNPSETVINNGIGMISAGNAVVFNAHPSARRVSLRTLSLMNEAITGAGGPANLLAMCADPSIETAQQVMRTKGIRLLVVTGGAVVVKAAFQSGKKVIAAGPGNPPVVVDETADLAKAGHDIVASASLDNNIICTSEKESFCVASVIDRLLEEMARNGAYVMTRQQAAELRKHLFVEEHGPGKPGVIRRELIGKNAGVILARIGINAGDAVRLAVYKAEPDDPLVWTEQLMPVFPVVPVANCDEGIDFAVRAEHGFGHTASMFSRNIDKLSAMARRINTSIFIKNGPNYAGLGLGGEGHTSFTIASPTGEGMTNARHFSRYRRCTLVDHFRIV